MLVATVGVEANILKVRPPLIFNGEHTDIALGIMARAFNAL